VSAIPELHSAMRLPHPGGEGSTDRPMPVAVFQSGRNFRNSAGAR